MLPKGIFCSGANDRQLCVWSLDGDLLSTIERQEEESILLIVTTNGKRRDMRVLRGRNNE